MKALIVVLLGLVLCGSQAAPAQKQETKAKKVHQWWNDRPLGEPLNSPNAQRLPLISVKGNRLVDPQGNVVSEGRAPLPILSPRAGWHEQSADTWWEATCQALKQATSVPLGVAERAREVAAITAKLGPITNPNMKSDLTTASALADAAITGALANVDINLGSIKDEAFVRQIRSQVSALK